jgi:hypothetical protein
MAVEVPIDLAVALEIDEQLVRVLAMPECGRIHSGGMMWM